MKLLWFRRLRSHPRTTGQWFNSQFELDVKVSLDTTESRTLGDLRVAACPHEFPYENY